MKNRWSDSEAEALLSRYGRDYSKEIILRSYSGRLLGSEKSLVLHGGGNTSLKGEHPSIHGESCRALFIKASGFDLATIEPEDHVAVDMERLESVAILDDVSDQAMLNELLASRLDQGAPVPSIETLVHAVLPGRFVDHTHADSILALTNQEDGEDHVRRALGDGVAVLPYVKPGFSLGRQAAQALSDHSDIIAMVWMHHGIVVWGETARESYDRMIELVSRAETYLDQAVSPKSKSKISKVADSFEQQLAAIAPIVRGLLATPTPGDRHSCQRVVLQALTDTKTNALLANLKPSLLVSPPLTGDHLFRTKPLPAWLQNPDFDDEESLRSQLESVLTAYSHNYQAYFERHKSRLSAVVTAHDAKPRVLFIDGLGALCAGTDATSARIVRDITDQTLAVKGRIAAMTGVYRVPGEEQLFDMEYLLQQQLKLTDHDGALTGTVAMVTGAAGAIGSGISARLLKAGAHVVIADVDESRLAEVREELEVNNADRVMAVRQDVSDPDSVAASFSKVFQTWGGLDSLVINAGLAHVSTLEQMDIDQFRRLEGVNTDGTLILLQAASQVFRKQRTGGDVVLISTKNVFAPGAEFGAYSATKAAAHQLARIASQEMAADDVRVNMVAPDAVFSHGTRRSGLWDEVGPGRMRARGLDEAGLEAYYRDRNLLKARITADHVAEGVLFFLERRTPTTGATLPIDGGLPDATPR